MSTLSIILVVVLLLFLFGAWPRWQYARGWGYGPAGIIGVILLVFIVLILTKNLNL